MQLVAAQAERSSGWHALTVEEVQRRWSVDKQGLDSAEAKRRLRQSGANRVEPVAERSRWRLFADQLANLESGLLAGAGALSAMLGELVDLGAIATVLGANTGIGYWLERRSQALLASFDRADKARARVRRDGKLLSVPVETLVPGDLLLLAPGDVVPADARVVHSRHLSCDEALLTGESEPQLKSPQPVAPNTPLAERTSMVFSGTPVASGRGRALVVATGPLTEVARIGALTGESRAPPTPLERRLSRLSRRVAGVAVGGAGLSLLTGLAHGLPLGAVLRTAVALGLAALPEGLPAVSTAALVRAMGRMRSRGMVVRRLSSAETLGGVTVICCDKTGTLTLNEMRVEVADIGREVRELHFDEAHLFDDRLSLLLLAGVLNNEVEATSSTERALLAAAEAAGADVAALRRRFPTQKLQERRRGANYMVSAHQGGLVFVKGAPEEVLALCSHDWEAPLDRDSILCRNQMLARRALRVLAFGWRRQSEPAFRYLGMVGLRDPVRPGAAEAVAGARRAGIRTLIVTGDQQATAAAVAREVGLTGATLDAAEAVRRARSGFDLRQLAALSRAAPADKLALVELLHARGEIVAMAGDGFNDAPALKSADIGIAVGTQASELSRQVADVLLTDADLRSILAAVAEGRIVQDNLRRAIRYLFATNLSELALVLGASTLGLPAPLTPLMLLFINMLTDTLPALALAWEPGDSDVLARPPAPPEAPLLSGSSRILRDGLGMAALGAAGAVAGGRSLAFGVLAGAQLAYAAACRAPDAPGRNGLSRVLGGTVAMQGLALLGLPRLLGVGSPLLALGGLGVGLAVPLVLHASDEIVRTKGEPSGARRDAPPSPWRGGCPKTKEKR